MAKEKYALLDTDFISKMHLIRKDEANHLIDHIIEIPNYRFYCHEQIRTELKRHNIAGSMEWLDRQILTKTVNVYSDEKILDKLQTIYRNSTCAMYVQLLKTACDAYKKDYFEEHFKKIQELDHRTIAREQFLEMLKEDEESIGEGQNLGEIKTYLLLQVLKLIVEEKIYVFCSDDKNARSGIISIGGVKCISVLSSFLRLQKEVDFQKSEAEPYIQFYLNFCVEREQTTFKVQEASKQGRMLKVPCEQVIKEIYEGKLEELPTGVLRYIK